jgi:uncharacterized cupin superfamily protein
MPKIDIDAIPLRTGSAYPAEFKAVVIGRERQPIGDAGGLTQFGVNRTRIRPGAASSLRHWHEVEEEMVFILEGEMVLVDASGETVLRAGDAAVFRPGTGDGHHLVNRSGRDAILLEIGTRPERDVVHYSDVDLVCRYDGDGDVFTRHDGETYPAEGQASA